VLPKIVKTNGIKMTLNYEEWDTKNKFQQIQIVNLI
jgi:hypothetical protein